MRLHISKKSMACFSAAAAMTATMAVVAVPGNAYADTRPPAPATLDEALNDMVRYGDPAAWAAKQADHEQHWGSPQPYGLVCTRAGCRWAHMGALYDGIGNDASQVTFGNLEVTPAGSPTVKSVERGVEISEELSTTLTNPGDETLMMTSAPMTKTYHNSVTSQVTQQVSTGNTVSAELKVGPLINLGDSLSTTYTWGTSKETTSGEDVEVTIPSQTIPVPPHSSRKVHGTMTRTVRTGKVNLTGDLNGRFTQCVHSSLQKDDGSWLTVWGPGYKDGNKDCKTYSVFDLAVAASHGDTYGNLPQGFGISGHHSVSVPGVGTYETHTGADVAVTVDRPVPLPGWTQATPQAAGRIGHAYSIPLDITSKAVHTWVTTH
ncbi:hypothetical protein D7231_33970 [Streptomyces klenkii]|uniref:Uncharacterized protein n=1 Tax=Streptomyces klenkii TaxID=1420899 RepID=A0A3B0AHG5_9ACTN|nr:ETX/MTX2 family pore-forming toxin [Streptomyces klenkii]RKN59684.1 hypothetical protein D7231_33970 [Streptomyces klenkii]